MSVESKTKTEAKESNDKEYEDWKEGKKKRIDDLYEKIRSFDTDIDKIWDEYGVDKEEYWKQKHYIDYIKWQQKIKDRKSNEKIREQKRKEYEEKQREREKDEAKQKYITEIELINFLINYCLNLYPDSNKKQADEKKEDIDIEKKLSEDKSWNKEKGLEVIQSKKSKQEEEAPKKGKKHRKQQNREEKPREEKFEIPYNVQVQF